MKVAVDVKGTLEGPRRKQIVEIIKFLLNRGDQVVVWSNGLGRQGAEGLEKEYGIKLSYEDKFSKRDASEWGVDLFDLAIEDDKSQDYLAAKKFLWVHNIPEDLTENNVEQVLNDKIN